MKTYAVRRARTKTTGHIRVPGSRDLYCGKPAGAPNDYARALPRFKMCARCVKAEAADRAEATATAEAWLDQAPASPPAPARPETAEDAAARASVRDYIAREHPPLAALLNIDPAQAATDAATTATAANAEREAAMTTWRAEWISARAASPTPTLFDVEPAGEQGALFA
ncbi:hypothetical protein ABZ690_21045 [Streptomyces sp. NPDC006967]|uniref:hypothetical protein n=1 Tax=unclassified Streptomyces TaxID=2593676 RepID=UPI0033E2C44E